MLTSAEHRFGHPHCSENMQCLQTRSPGSGGAIYVSVAVPSPFNRDGLVSIRDTTFIGNWARIRGGTIHLSADISTEVKGTTIENSDLNNKTATVCHMAHILCILK